METAGAFACLGSRIKDSPAHAIASRAAFAHSIDVPYARPADLTPMVCDAVPNRTKGFLREFLSVGDVKEAKLCLSELREAPKSGEAKDLSGVVEAAMQEMFDAQVGVVEAARLGCGTWWCACFFGGGGAELHEAPKTGGAKDLSGWSRLQCRTCLTHRLVVSRRGGGCVAQGRTCHQHVIEVRLVGLAGGFVRCTGRREGGLELPCTPKSADAKEVFCCTGGGCCRGWRGHVAAIVLPVSDEGDARGTQCSMTPSSCCC